MTATASPRSAAETVHLELPPEPRYIRMARLVGAGLANELGLDLDRLDDVRLAIGEACSLAVQAGAARVILDFGLGDSSLDIVVEASVAGEVPDLGDEADLTEQILSVACSAHELSRSDTGWQLRMRFDGGG
jgi:anti-sigma regulatory factor (Ser/Thr protein kinase)